jgi:hypothetical protein
VFGEGGADALDNLRGASGSVATWFRLPFGGGLIHILLVLALVILVINLVSGRRSAL